MAQIPVVDVRPLLAGPTGRHSQPMLPQPERLYAKRSTHHHRTNFIAGLGPLRPRLTGHGTPWVSESYYVDCSALVRVRRSAVDGRRWTAPRLFSNFYTDGVVGRLEIGFSTPVPADGAWAHQVLAAPARLRGRPETPLADLGPEFVRHLLAATTDRAHDARPESWWIQAGPPAVIAEVCRADQLPGRARPYPHRRADPPAAQFPDDGELAYRWYRHRGVRALAWEIVQRRNPAEVTRRLRIHVSRLHADFAAFSRVLGLCQGGQLDVDRPAVQRYLVRTAGMLNRRKRHGFAQSNLLAEILATACHAYGDVAVALDYLGEVTNSPALASRLWALQDAVSPTGGTYLIEELTISMTDNTYHTTVSGGQVGAVSVGSGNAYGRVDAGPQPEVEAALAALSEAVAQLRGALSEEDAATLEDTAEGLRREAQQAPPERSPARLERRLRTLFELATAAGGAGGAVLAAVQAARAALGL
ncbi:MAG TPA: hypothetical protein VNV66_09130 [Pilimelia sp.]|nr:hypothetical protein [Pilimelia sp.]